MKLVFHLWVLMSTIQYQSQTLLSSDIQLNSQWEAQLQHNNSTEQNASWCHVEISSYPERGVDLLNIDNISLGYLGNS